MRLLGVLVLIAALIGTSVEEAGTFYAEMPKHAPRMGRRSTFLAQKPVMSTLFDGALIRLSSLLSSLRQSESFDRGGEKCLTARHILQIQAFGATLPPSVDETRLHRGVQFRDENNWTEDDQAEDHSSRQHLYPTREIYQRNQD